MNDLDLRYSYRFMYSWNSQYTVPAHPKEAPHEIWLQCAQWFQRRRCLKMLTHIHTHIWTTEAYHYYKLIHRWANNWKGHFCLPGEHETIVGHSFQPVIFFTIWDPLCADVQKNIAFSNGVILTFWCENCLLNAVLVSYDKKILHLCSCSIEFIKPVGENR